MQKFILTAIFSFCVIISIGQNKAEAEKLVDEGINYHDKGDYEGAIVRYDKALELDKDNLLALVEKGFSLYYLKKYEEAIACCQRAIKTHPGNDPLKSAYVTYGSCLDALNKTDSSILIYDEGIKLFPNYHKLYFNKGVTFSSVKKYDDAIFCFQKAVSLDPAFPGAHNAVGRVEYWSGKNIPALLAFCRFFVLEPQSGRAKENLGYIQKILVSNVEQKKDNSITVSIDSKMLNAINDSANQSTENNFASTEFLLQIGSALDYDKKYANETEVERFIRKFEVICSSLKETKENKRGFFWEFYAPYFIEMYDKNFIETFGYIVFAGSEKPEVNKWLETHKSEISKFYEWDKGFFLNR